MSDLNEIDQPLLNSLDKRGLLEMTKAYFRSSLLESLKKDNFYNTAPSGFNVNTNIIPIKDKNTIDIIRLQYSLINDFLIRTKMAYTQNIFTNEIKTLIDSPVPMTDSELVHNLNLSTKQISTFRLNSNLNTSPKDLVKSTYLYQLINLHCSLVKIDTSTQTLQIPEINIKKSIDIDEEMKKIDEKYNKKLNLDEILPATKANEIKFMEYKQECDKRYEENLKNEIERFKNIEECKIRLEESNKYLDKIESIRKDYETEYNKKNENIQKMKKILKDKEENLEKEYQKKEFDLNEMFLEKLKKLREENSRSNKDYLDEINNLNKEKINLEQTIKNLKDNHYNEMQTQLQKIKNDYQTRLESEKSILKEENEKNQKIFINNYTKNNNELSQLKKHLDSINLDKSGNKKELDAIKNKNNISILRNNDLLKKMSEDIQNRRKNMENLEEEQSRINKLTLYEFKNIRNDEMPIVFINQEEIEQIKRSEYYNNLAMNEKKESQRKKSIDDNILNNNFLNNKENISPYKNKPILNSSSSPFGKNNINNNKYVNNSFMNNNKNINSNMGIAGVNNYNNLNKMSSGIIEENIDIDNISASQKSKDQSHKKSGSFNNYNNNINNIQRGSLTTKLPPINQNQTNYSIKDDDFDKSKSRSKIGTASKKSNDNNYNINNVNNNLFNKSNKFNNINYNDKDEDDYGDGDFENNISSLNQNSVLNSNKKSVSNFGKIKNQNEASMIIQEEIDKQSHLGNNIKDSSESYNDFENTRGLIKKGINNYEGSGNFNNISKFKMNNQESEIKEEIEINNED